MPSNLQIFHMLLECHSFNKLDAFFFSLFLQNYCTSSSAYSTVIHCMCAEVPKIFRGVWSLPLLFIFLPKINILQLHSKERKGESAGEGKEEGVEERRKERKSAAISAN